MTDLYLHLYTYARRVDALAIAAFVLLLACAQVGHAQLSRDTAELGPQLFLEGQLGGELSPLQAEFVFPVRQDRDRLWYGLVGGRYGSGSREGGSLGLGYRRVFFEGQRVLGLSATLDLLRSEESNQFARLTLGSELRARDWELRASAYLPENGSARSDAGVRASIDGNAVVVTDLISQERALRGIDLEFGNRLGIRGQSLWVYAGFYHFQASGYSSMTGPRARLAWRFDLEGRLPISQLELGAEWRTDKVRGDQALLRLELRFGGAKNAHASSWQSRALVDRVRRVDLVTGERTRTSGSRTGIHPGTGRPYSGIYYAAEGASGAGTRTDPTDLASAVSLAGPDGVVVPIGDAGVIQTPGIVLRDGMSLVGGGGTLPVSTQSGAQTSLSVGGSAATLNGTSAVRDVVALANGADDVLVDTLTVSGGRDGIRGTNNGRVQIRGVSVLNPGRRGMILTNPSGLAFSNVSVAGAAREGIYLNRPGGEVSGQALSIASSGTRGLYIQNATADVSLSDLSVATSGLEGVRVSNGTGRLELMRADIDGAGRQGLFLSNPRGDVRLDDVSVANTGREGLLATNVRAGFTLERSRLETGIGRRPVDIEVRDSGALTLSDNRIGLASDGSNSIRLRTSGNATSASAALLRNEISGANTGIYVDHRAGSLRLTLDGNTVTGTTRGIDINSRRTLNAAVIGNTVDGQLRIRTQTNGAMICAGVRSNSATSLRLQRSGRATFDVVGRDQVEANNTAPVRFSPSIASFGDVPGCP